MSLVALILAASLTAGCVGPMGRLGLEPQVVDLLTKDTAAWCVTVEAGTLFLGIAAIRITYWRDNAPERGMSNMLDCVTMPLQ